MASTGKESSATVPERAPLSARPRPKPVPLYVRAPSWYLCKSMACLVVTCLEAIFDKIISLIKNNLYMHRPQLQLKHERNINHNMYHRTCTIKMLILLSYAPSITVPCRPVGSTLASCSRRVVPYLAVQWAALLLRAHAE